MKITKFNSIITVKLIILFCILYSESYAQNWSLETKPIIGTRIPRYKEKNNQKDGNVLGARSSSFYAQINNTGYIFGGFGINEIGRKSFLNDLWKVDLEKKQYTWLGGQGENLKYIASNKMSLVEDTSIIYPSFRTGSTSFIRENKFYIIGGEGLDSLNRKTFFNDMWYFDLNRNIWKEVVFKNQKESIDIPSKRSNSLFWQNDNEIYLMGGLGYSNIGRITNLSDFWKYNFRTEVWTLIQEDFSELHSKGNIPILSLSNPMIFEGAICFVYEQKLYLIGGLKYSSNGMYEINDNIWTYNTSQPNKWEILKTNNKFDSDSRFFTPQSRTGSSYWRHFNDIYIYGGFSQSESKDKKYSNDLWKYDLKENTWKIISNLDFLDADKESTYAGIGIEDSTNSPGSRINSINFATANNLFMLGGWSKNLVDYEVTDELWNYHLPIKHKDTVKTEIVTCTLSEPTNTDSFIAGDKYEVVKGGGNPSYSFVIYSNPITNNILEFELTNAMGTINYDIIDISGVTHIKNELFITNNKEIQHINITNLLEGEYILQLKQKNQIQIARFTKK
jgi:N-acetylneuraminic acid mutarotase